LYLTKEEERIYNGEYGEVLEMAMNLLVSLGEIYGAERLIEISSAQVSGVSYKTIGEEGLNFLKDISRGNVRVSVPTTLNPAGMDLSRYEELNFPRDFVEKQLEIIECFKRIGVEIGCTCTPYLTGNLPSCGDHIAWAESSAVSYANSVIGARTNREGGPSALASALIGKTPLYGYHLDENRIPSYTFEVEGELEDLSHYGALGSLVGRIVKNEVPYFIFKNPISRDRYTKLKALGASLAASGGVALYHVEGITPECRMGKIEVDTPERITIDRGDIEEEFHRLNTSEERPDLICIGCPHCSLGEIKEVVDFIVKNNLGRSGFKCDLWVCTSIHIKAIADRMGYTEVIERAGGKVICDTCTVVAPVEEMGYKNIATNSGKAAIYLPSFCGSKVIYGSTWDVLRRGL